MITIVSMHDAICDFLQKKVADRFSLKSRTINQDGDESFVFKSPQIIRSGWILPKSIDSDISEDEEFPFIIPRIDKVENVKEQQISLATVEVYFGVYAPGTYDKNGKLVDDGSGYRDLWNLIESSRQAFFEDLTINNKYRLKEDYFEAEMIPEQIYPYWEGWLKAQFYVGFPMPKPDPNNF